MSDVDARAWPAASQATCEENNKYISVLAAVAASTTLVGFFALVSLPPTCYDPSYTTASSHATLASSSSVGATCASQLLTESGAGVAVLVLVVLSSFVLVLAGLSLTRLKGHWSEFSSRAIGNIAAKQILPTRHAMMSDAGSLTWYSYILGSTSLALCCILSLTDVGQFNCHLHAKIGSGPSQDRVTCDYNCVVLLGWPAVSQGITAGVWFYSVLLMKHLESSFDRDVAGCVPLASVQATPPSRICHFFSNVPSKLSELLFSLLGYYSRAAAPSEPTTLSMLASQDFDRLALALAKKQSCPAVISSSTVQIQKLVNEEVKIIFTDDFLLSPRVGTFQVKRGFLVLLNSFDPLESERDALDTTTKTIG